MDGGRNAATTTETKTGSGFPVSNPVAPTRESAKCTRNGTAIDYTRCDNEDITTEIILAQALDSLAQTMAQLKAVEFAQQDEIDISFAGKPDECPRRYLDQIQDYLAVRGTPLDRFRPVVKITKEGAAEEWLRRVTSSRLSWEMFVVLFLRKYDCAAVRAKYREQLFNRPQGPNEEAHEFIIEKWGLFERLEPHISVKESVQLLAGQLEPATRAILRDKAFTSLEHLVEVAGLVERDLRKDRQRREAQMFAAAPSPRYSDRDQRRPPQTRPPPPQNRPSLL